MILYKLIYSINMHTTVYQFWRFVYQFEQSVIDHYARISLYTLSFCTKIRLHVYHLSLPRRAAAMAVSVSDICDNTKLAREMSLLGNYETASVYYQVKILIMLIIYYCF